MAPQPNSLLSNTRWQIFFIATAILLLYFRTLSFEFIGLDEQSLLLEKRNFNKELSNIPIAFTQHVFQKENGQENTKSNKYYRPILTISFILDEQFSDKGFTVHHCTNLLIHFLAAIGLLFVLQQINIPRTLAFFFSLLFAVHPILVQAIAWIPGRNDSLVCAFILWSFYFLASQRKKSYTIFLHILFFILALFTKENAVVFVLLCSFYILWVQQKKYTQTDKVFLLSAYTAILMIWFAARNHAIGETSFSFGNKEGAFPLIFQYLQKTLLPVNLSVMSVVKDTDYAWVFLSVALLGTAIYFTKDIPWMYISFGLGWYVLFLLPTLLFSYFEGMEHRIYLPMAGLLMVVAHTDPLQHLTRNTTKLTLAFTSVILLFGTLTFFRVPSFANELSYWEDAFRSSKNSAVVCRDYGIILTKTGDYKNAEKAFCEGIRRDPNEILIHYNLGILYFKTQHFNEAEAELIRELQLDSTTNPLTYHVLGLICKQTGRKEDAEAMWQKALKLNPGFEPSINELKAKY